MSSTLRNEQPLKDPGKALGRVIENVPFATYQHLEGINASGLKEILRSPAHYQHWRMAPGRESPAMRLGKLTHLAVLEPEVYERTVTVQPDTPSNRGKPLIAPNNEWRDAAGEEHCIASQREHDAVRAMRDAVWAKPRAAELLRHGLREASIWWDHPFAQMRCKARVDFISSLDGGILVDLKTTDDARESEFARKVVQFRYDLQAAHYLEAGGITGAYSTTRFFFIVVERNPPYATVVYEMDDVFAGLGHQWREEAMAVYTHCVQTGAWPGLAEQQTLKAPRWAKAPGEDELLYGSSQNP